MSIQQSRGPAAALGGFYSPLSDDEQQVYEDAAARKIQSCFRGFRDNNKLFFVDNLLDLCCHCTGKLTIPKAELQELISRIYQVARSSMDPDFREVVDSDSAYGYGKYHRGGCTAILPFDAIEPFQGAYKVVQAALKASAGIERSLVNSPSPYYRRTFEFSPQALIFSKIPPPNETNPAGNNDDDDAQEANAASTTSSNMDEENRARLARTEVLLKDIAKLISGNKAQNVYIIPPMTPIRDGIGTLPWYPADLDRSIKNNFLELNVIPEQAPFTKRDAYLCLLDVLQSIDWFRSKGYVHRDLTDSNILLQWSPTQKRYVGVIGDCDFLKRGFGWDELAMQSSYAFWDPWAVCNLSTPYVDRYCVALALFSLSSNRPDWEKCEQLRNMIMACVATGTPHRFEFSNPAITAAVSICHESMRALLHILNENKVDWLGELERRVQQNHSPSELIDPALVVDVLQGIVKHHKNLFTHEAIVEAMKQVSKKMRREGNQVYNTRKLRWLIKQEMQKAEAASNNTSVAGGGAHSA